MIAISLWQPWASALFAPANPGTSPRAIKEYETRHWPMPARYIGQEVAIHAAKRDTADERDFWTYVVMGDRRELYGHAFFAIRIQKYSDLPRGAIIGTATFASPVSTNRMDAVSEMESEWGNFSADRWAWPVVSTNHFEKAIPCVGRQGFFQADI